MASVESAAETAQSEQKKTTSTKKKSLHCSENRRGCNLPGEIRNLLSILPSETLKMAAVVLEL